MNSNNIEMHDCECGFRWRHGKSGTHDCGPQYRQTIRELRAASAPQVVADERAAQADSILGTTIELARCIWRDNYKNEAPDWEPLTDLAGVLSQIDNMVCGMRRAAPVQPVAVPDGWRDAAMETAVQAVVERAGESEKIDVINAFDAIRSLKKNRHALPESCSSFAAPAAHGDAKDAERWREALQYVGADRSPALGCNYFVLRGIHAIPGTDLMRGGVAGHFTDAIDAAIAAKAAS